MKKIIASLVFIVGVSILVFNSCKQSANFEINSEFARYIAAFSSGKVSSSSDIQIELTQDIPTVELGKEIDQELFKFSPGIKGKAYWTSTRNIKFVPEAGELESGKTYEARFLLNKVLQVDSDFKEFKFHFSIPEQNFSATFYPYSPIKDNDLKWNSVSGQLILADDAELAKVEKMFSLKANKEAKVKLTPTEVKGRYNVLVDSLERKSSATEYELEINGKSISASKDSETHTFNIPGTDNKNLEVLDVRVAYDPQQCIRITFSNPLSLNQNIQGLVNLDGVDNFSYEIQKNVLRLYLDKSYSSSSVTLNVYKEIKDFENKRLAENASYSLTFNQDKPSIKIRNTGNVLPDSKNLIIPFKAVNLWAVDVKVIKIFENNILGYLQTNDFGENGEIKRFGRLILKKRIRLDEDPTVRLNEWNDFSLDLSSLIEQDPGSVYRLEFSMKKEYSLYPVDGVIPQISQEDKLERFDNGLTEEDTAPWDVPRYYYNDYDWSNYKWSERNDPATDSYYVEKRENCMVLASNIGMTAKLGSEKKILIALTDILTTKPISGAVVDIYNYQMQRIGSAKSDGNGFAEVEYRGGVPFVAIASRDKERGYLKVTQNLALSMSSFDVSGKELQKGLKGYIYGERGVWRPGDSIFVTFILEDKNQTLPKDHPVSLDLYNPQGQLYQKYTSGQAENGFYSFRMATSEDAITGNWQARVKVGGASFSKTLKIETVKPNRLKIRLNTGELIDASNKVLNASLSSQWLHGAPAANLSAKVEMTLSTVSNPFEGYTKYSFNNPASNFYSDTYTIFDGKLDASGNATVRANLPQAESAPGMLRAHFTSRVFESGGDASIYGQSVPYSPYSHYVGIKSPTDKPYEWLETDRDNKLEIVTLNAAGKLVNRSDINVTIYKLRWSWWWSSEYENLASYVNSTSAEVVSRQTISTVGGKGTVNLRIDYPEWGRYLVMAKDEKSGHTTGDIVYVDWPASMGRSNKDDASGATMLTFSTDKNDYKVGEKVTVTIPQSSKGRALVSLESGSTIIQKEWVETSDSKDTEYTFTVTENMAPNFYVFISLLQPHEQTNNGSPIRMYGVRNIPVLNEDSRLEPVITMPDELRPEKEFTVSVSEKKKKDMTYTLAIVDEGLLDLTGFRTPDAWSDFYSRQSLGVRTWDMFDLVVGASSGHFGALLSIGGDEALKPKTHSMSRFKPVVKFLGPFTIKGGKTANHKITLPSYFGSVRVMVVAGNPKGAYGSTEKAVAVKNPLMILSTLPRVAGPNEEILLPVNVFAMDKKVRNVQVSVKSSGLFQFTEGTSKSVAFTETGDKVIYFKVKVGSKVGHEKVEIKATGGGETATETINIEIRNPNPPVLMSSQAIVSSKDTAALNLSIESPQPSDWVKLEVSRMPGIDLSKNMAFLMDYPHGCTEQVTSRAFPALYVKAFRQFTDAEKAKLDNNVKEAIKIITSRQLSNGGIAYWPGDRYPTEWVTTYAGHFLIEAQNAGFEVPSSVLNKLLNFQKSAAQKWNQRDMYNSYYSYSMSDLQQSYRLYMLALASKPELGAMNRMKEMKELTPQARWRLAATYAISGKKDAANQLISGVSDEVNKYSFNNNTYGSSERDMAMIMETYLLLGKTEKALKLSRKVSEGLSRSYISTQTASFSLVAMAKLAEKMGKGVINYSWTLNGVAQKSGNTGQVFQEIMIKPQENINVKFENSGEGDLFVRLIGYSRPLEDKAPAVNNGANIYVKYVDENGKDINVSSLKQGTEFYASVVVQNVSGQTLTDMALTQVFASGWEIFNERLFGQNENVSTNRSYNYQDIRDDRVITYFNIGSGYSMGFRVRLQAAYCGRFYLPATLCEAMYSPDEQSRTTGRWVEIVQ